jgi:hypothetical protein
MMQKRPAPLDIHEDRPASIAQSDLPLSPEGVAIQAAGKAFAEDWEERQEMLKSNPLIPFLEAHRVARTPDDHTICGYAGIKITLADLKAMVEAAAE